MLGDARKYEDALKPADLEKAGQQRLPVDMPEKKRAGEGIEVARDAAKMTEDERRLATELTTHLALVTMAMAFLPKGDQSKFNDAMNRITIDSEASLLKLHREIVAKEVAKAMNGDRLPNAGSFGVA
jgi:hypothetical protein